MFARKVRSAAVIVIFAFLVGRNCSAVEEPLVNKGFEIDENGDGFPDGWTRVEPAVLGVFNEAPPVTRTGSGAVHLHRFPVVQPFSFLPNHYYSVRSHIRGEDGVEIGRAGFEFERLEPPLRMPLVDGESSQFEYSPVLIGDRSPDDTTGARVKLGSRSPDWIWHDDVALFSEQVANGSLDAEDDGNGYPDGWSIFGEPSVDSIGLEGSTAVRVNSTDFIAQEALLNVKWVGQEGNTIRVDSATPSLDTAWMHYSIQGRAPRQPGSLTPAALVSVSILSPSTTELVWVDHIHVDRVLLVSELVSPNGDGVYDVLDLKLRMNEETFVGIDLKDSLGNTVASIEPGAWYTAGPHTVLWAPSPSIPSATYELEFGFEGTDGLARTLHRTLVLDRGDFHEGVPALAQDRFLAGFYSGGTAIGQSDSELRLSLIREAARLNATTVFMAASASDRTTVLDYALTVGIDIALFMQFSYGYVFATDGERGLDVTDFRRRTEPEVEEIKDATALFGYYTMDEPSVEISPRVFIMNSIFQDLDPDHPPLNTLNDISRGAEKLDIIEPPVYFYDDYPPNWNTPLGDLAGFPERIEEAGRLAGSRDLPFWAALRAFSDPIRRYLTRAETLCEAYLSLANGADGIVYFFLGAERQSPSRPEGKIIYGVIDGSSSPSITYPSILDILTLLETRGSLFLDLSVTSPAATCLPPAYCRTQQDSLNNPYLWIINTDCLEPRTVAADLTVPSGSGHDVIANRPLEWLNAGRRVQVTLPPGGAVLIRLGQDPPMPPAPSDDLQPAFGSDASYSTEPTPIAGPGPDDRYAFMDHRDGLLYLHTPGTFLEIWDVRSATPEILSRIQAGRAGSLVRTDGNILTLSSWVTGVVVVDVSNPANPTVEGEYMGYNGNAENCEIAGDTLYVAAKSYGVTILDASVPKDLQIVNRFPTVGLAQDVRVRDGIAYIADGIGGLTIADVSDPFDPTILSNIRIPGDDARQVILNGDVCYVIGKPTTVAAVDVSDPGNPVLLDTEDTFHAERAWANTNTLVVADRVAGLALLDISEPGNPRLAARARVEGFPVEAIYEGDRLFVLDHEGNFAAYTLKEPFPADGQSLLMLR
jgi:hypothetical protein